MRRGKADKGRKFRRKMATRKTFGNEKIEKGESCT